MNKSTIASLVFAAVSALSSTQIMAADVTSPPVAPTKPSKPAAPTLSAEQRASQQAAQQANFAALSREVKIARKGHQQRPVKPSAPTNHQGR